MSAAAEAESQTKISIKKAKPESSPIGRRPIGFRGNHLHGRPLYDPVYPTSKVPTTLIPRYRKDWRNSGRALLTVGMSLLEGSLLKHTKQCLSWQSKGPCGRRCQNECAKSPWRCLCSWRVRGLHKHIVDMDGILCEYKGRINTNKPLFAVQRKEVEKNKFKAECMRWDESTGSFVFTEREANLHEGFGLLHNRDDTQYDSCDKQYDSDEDITADSSGSDSEQWPPTRQHSSDDSTGRSQRVTYKVEKQLKKMSDEKNKKTTTETQNDCLRRI
eukprot:GHVS01054574.1.p1 GENE.GHVS01054574.1~~GHVS01054574.1.p1  ORF type:complete len:273 (+),score=32.26 GHVS01054574.1:225-1043(+)